MTLTYEMKHTAITSSVACSKPSICFVALRAYNILSGRSDIHHTGGAEVQQVQIATWLVHRGYPVSFVTLDYGQPDGVLCRGVRVFKAYSEKEGVRGLRFLHPRWSGLWAAMARADADIYYQRGCESETGQVALWCHLHSRRFIFAAANMVGCDPALLSQETWGERTFYRLGIRLADAVVAQTADQQKLLRDNMGLPSVLIRSCRWVSENSSVSERATTLDPGSTRVLWVGRISRVKRFEWLLDIACRCPDFLFEVVGVPGDNSNYSSSMVKRAGAISNVKMHGYVPYAEMTKYYQRCHVLCCTSPCEGFPNTFLEAWSLGIPVVSTFDPDGVIAAQGLGWAAHDVDGIAACLRGIIRKTAIWDAASRAVRQYYLANHTPQACLPAFEQLLQRVTGCQTRPV